MGRQHTFMDREFSRGDYDPSDHGTFQPGLVFVMMPFKAEGMSDVYATIKEECHGLGLNAVRVDENVGSGFVIKDIISLIEQAEFIVCDLSHERPNVYYELGYAHGVGNEADDILLIAREGTVFHFDIAPLRVHLYASLEQLSKILATSLSAMISVTRR